MNIGDKVRLVHGKEEGVIFRFLAGNVVEIEIEDGFRIPVLRNEVVLISPLENERLRRDESRQRRIEPSVSRTSAPFSQKGLYLIFAPVNDRTLSLHLVNNSDWVLPFSAFEDKEGKQNGLAAGALAPRSSQKLTELLIKDFEEWPTFEVQALFFKEGKGTARPPFQKRLKCRAQSFYKRKQQAPVLNKEAYVYQLDEEARVDEKSITASTGGISGAELREKMLTSTTDNPSANRESVNNVVDLHLEKLNPSPSIRTNSEKLAFQLEVFERQLEKAIAAGRDDITFIHGAGNGVLRDELHRRLSKHPNVQYFKDAQKEKFGYGATFVKIK